MATQLQLTNISDTSDIQTNIQEMKWEGTNWIDLAQDKDRWDAVISTIMNMRLPQIAGNSLIG